MHFNLKRHPRRFKALKYFVWTRLLFLKTMRIFQAMTFNALLHLLHVWWAYILLLWLFKSQPFKWMDIKLLSHATRNLYFQKWNVWSSYWMFWMRKYITHTMKLCVIIIIRETDNNPIATFNFTIKINSFQIIYVSWWIQWLKCHSSLLVCFHPHIISIYPTIRISWIMVCPTYAIRVRSFHTTSIC